MDKSKLIPICLMGGKNYVGWSFHLKHFVQGQGLAGFLDGTSTEPIDDKTKTTWIQITQRW